MSDEEFQRARRPEQKEERRALLLDAARGLLLERPSTHLEFSLNELSGRAGMAKSNVYRYFESREAILIELLRQEWISWFQQLHVDLASDPELRTSCALAPNLTTLDHLVLRFAESLAKRPLLGQLCSILSTVLEHNVEPHTVKTFKLESLHFVRMLAQFLHDKCSFLSPAQYEELFHTGFAALVGLWSFSHPSPAVAEVLAAPELAPFRHDFGRDFARHLSLLARGIVALEPRGS